VSIQDFRGVLAVLVVAATALVSGCGASSSGAQATGSASTPSRPPATQRQVARCTPRGAHVVVVSHDAVVYTVAGVLRAGPLPGSRAQGVAVFGCVIGIWKRVALGTVRRLEKVALNGTAVAYASSQVQGIDTSRTDVLVADIRRRHKLFDVPAGRIAIAPSFVSVDALVVTPDGTVAWIQHGGTAESPGNSVHAASVAKPSDHQLASGPAINPRSLRLVSGTVSWLEDGQRRSARI